MTATVEQTQNELSRMIRLVIGGEEVLITDGGRPVAKLTAVGGKSTSPDRAKWLESLRELRDKTATGKKGRMGEEILREDREQRD